jgi:hypothetical protein
MYSLKLYNETENWCRTCLHPLLEKAGDVNKSKIARYASRPCLLGSMLTPCRKMILSTLARHDYSTAREVFSNMSDTGRDDRITRYLMYKVGLHDGDADFGRSSRLVADAKLTHVVAECLDVICRQSSKDATLLYACALEAKDFGDRGQAIAALGKILDKYDHAAPADVHLPILLR